MRREERRAGRRAAQAPEHARARVGRHSGAHLQASREPGTYAPLAFAPVRGRVRPLRRPAFCRCRVHRRALCSVAPSHPADPCTRFVDIVRVLLRFRRFFAEGESATTMPDLGRKYTCYSCHTKFYDLGKPVPLCPKCGADQRDADEAPVYTAPRSRRVVEEPVEEAGFRWPTEAAEAEDEGDEDEERRFRTPNAEVEEEEEEEF